MEPYYYSRMNKIQKNAYLVMKTGLLAREASFAVPRLDGRELEDIFFKLRLDCPEIFYAVLFHYRYFQNSGSVQMIPEYLFDKGKVQEHQKAMLARVEKLIRPVCSLTEWEKEAYIHDFICSKVRYDKLKKPYSHEIIGPLGQGVGVCEGIAKTVKILCDALGIWCIIAVSDANPDKKIKYRHAWNIVRIGGTNYQLDVTFDNSLGRGEEIRYDYFNLGDKQFFRDHEPVMYEVPPCNEGNHFYYREKKLSFTKMEEVCRRALQALKKGKPLIFHWRGGHLTHEVLAALQGQLEEIAGQKEKHVRIGLNRTQAVFHITFGEEAAEEELMLEDAGKDELE